MGGQLIETPGLPRQDFVPRADHRTTAQLSAQERSKLTDAIIAQVGELTRRVNMLTQVMDGQLSREKEYNALTSALEGRLSVFDMEDVLNRLYALDRRAAVLNASFMARLRGLLTGR